MGQRTIYVRDEHESLWERAKELAGDGESLSSLIAEGLQYIIAKREAAAERETLRLGLSQKQPRPSTGRIKRGEGTLIGNAGEYAVMSELLKRGIIAGITPRNTPGFDILATANTHAVYLRVKTKTASTPSWQWNAHLETGNVFVNLQPQGDFVVLVDLDETSAVNRYFIVPTSQVADWLQADFETWLATPGRNPEKPHSPSNRRRILRYSDYADRLKRYEDAWDSLGLVER